MADEIVDQVARPAFGGFCLELIQQGQGQLTKAIPGLNIPQPTEGHAVARVGKNRDRAIAVLDGKGHLLGHQQGHQGGQGAVGGGGELGHDLHGRQSLGIHHRRQGEQTEGVTTSPQLASSGQGLLHLSGHGVEGQGHPQLLQHRESGVDGGQVVALGAIDQQLGFVNGQHL